MPDEKKEGTPPPPPSQQPPNKPEPIRSGEFGENNSGYITIITPLPKLKK